MRAGCLPPAMALLDSALELSRQEVTSLLEHLSGSPENKVPPHSCAFENQSDPLNIFSSSKVWNYVQQFDKVGKCF